MKLSRLQITTLILLAKKAFDHLAAQARARGEQFDSSKATFDQWRRSQVFAACGRHGLSVATNDDYRAIHARFADALGESGVAMVDLLKHGTEKARQLRFVINRELRAANLHENYAESIALGKFHRPVDDLDEGQLRQLLMTIKARTKSRRRAHSLAPLGGEGQGEGAIVSSSSNPF